MTGLRVAVCGSGQRSRTVWQRHLRASPRFELVGVHDVSPQSLDAAAALGTIGPKQRFTDLGKMLRETRPDALLVCPINEAHAQAIQAGLEAGAHVLVEKPFTTRLEDAVRLTSLARDRGLQLGVVQNWRTKSVGQALRAALVEGRIGALSHILFRYVRDRELSHLPSYLFEEQDPLLFAMSIHHFDLFRFILREEIVQVEGHSFRPPWSRYTHPSGVQLWMRTEAGVHISYVATFSSRNGHLPQESLQVEGELGSLCNDSDYSEPPLLLSLRGQRPPIDLTAAVTDRSREQQYDRADRALLDNFADAVASQAALVAPAKDNLGTLAVVEAARRALREGRAMNPQQILREPEASTPHSRSK